MAKCPSLGQEAEKLMEIKGNVKGEGFLTSFEYVRYKKGEQGVKMLEEKLKEIGWPVKIKDIRPMEWYPESLGVLIILTSKEIFNWTDKDIFEIGSFAAKTSFLLRMMMRYFLSARKTFQESPKYWSKNYDFGELEAHEFSEKEKYVVLRVKNFKFHPVMCVFFAGYFLQTAKFVVKSEKITIKETKCVFKGDPYTEYVIRWV